MCGNVFFLVLSRCQPYSYLTCSIRLVLLVVVMAYVRRYIVYKHQRETKSFESSQVETEISYLKGIKY